MSDPIDLGRPFICLKGVDLPATDVFYGKLGFTSKKDLTPAQDRYPMNDLANQFGVRFEPGYARPN